MKEIIFAGLGGQGVLTMGLVLAEIANHRGDHVTWVPSYGSAMRGGMANCTVKYGKERIYNPSQENCDILLAMHDDALQLFEEKVVSGGTIIFNADIMSESCVKRTDINVFGVKCSSLAEKINNPRGANIIMTGAVLKACQDFTEEEGLAGMCDMFRKKGKAKFEEQNIKALKEGFSVA